jgi:prolyl-tRNA editing enzyme YbaK/EbsC (Cys-tRNA(Pro) deacylase)
MNMEENRIDHPAVRRVQNALDAFGMKLTVVQMDRSTRTALDAAYAIGCELGQIVKSLVFRGELSSRPILVLASGVNHVDVRIVAGAVGENLEKADAEFVKEKTGFVIGGVPPLGHNTPIQTYFDKDLMDWDVLWAAAGTPNSVFRLTPHELMTITKGIILEIK